VNGIVGALSEQKKKPIKELQQNQNNNNILSTTSKQQQHLFRQFLFGNAALREILFVFVFGFWTFRIGTGEFRMEDRSFIVALIF